MDIRVKYAGMFHRKKATPGKFMMRLRVPNGKKPTTLPRTTLTMSNFSLSVDYFQEL